MNLPDLKHLDKIIALCRKRGVVCIKIDNVEITLGDVVSATPSRRSKSAKAASTPQSDTTPFESDTLSPEALLMWSTGGFQETAEETQSE